MQQCVPKLAPLIHSRLKKNQSWIAWKGTVCLSLLCERHYARCYNKIFDKLLEFVNTTTRLTSFMYYSPNQLSVMIVENIIGLLFV